MGGPRPGRGLVGHARHPLHEAGPEEARERHQHEAHRAVGPAEVPPAAGEAGGDHVRVHRVEDEHRPRRHAKGRGGVDPVAVPARGAEPRVDLAGVVASLAGDDRVVPGERPDIAGVAEPPGVEAGSARTRPARSGGRVERGRDAGEVAFLPHPFEQHRADQPPPADESHVEHDPGPLRPLPSFLPSSAFEPPSLGGAGPTGGRSIRKPKPFARPPSLPAAGGRAALGEGRPPPACRPSGQAASNSPAAPWPPPMHIVTTP